MTRLLLDSSACIAFKKRHPEVIEILQHGLPVLISDHDFHKIPQIIVRHFSVLTA